MGIKFGPAGNADSFGAAGFKATVDAPRWLSDLGLNAYEYQCGRGVNIGGETAGKIGAQAKTYGITMSLHTPYFINLSVTEAARVEKNIDYILQSCRAASAMGAQRMVVHCGGVGKLSRDKAFANTIENVRIILSAMDQAGFTQTLCLETMGKKSVIGSAEEVFQLVRMDDRLLPCLDFGHLNARTGGGMNTAEDYRALFDQMENSIGHERAMRFHSHFSKIEYSVKGEVRHLTFDDDIYGPEFSPLAQVLAERGYEPTIICESRGTQAEDALHMQKLYRDACDAIAEDMPTS